MVFLAWIKGTLDWTVRDEGLDECILCSLLYTWVCSFKIFRHTFSLSGNHAFDPYSLKLDSNKKFLFTLCSRYILGIFFTLFFICTHLWIIVYLQFTNYGLVFVWLTVTANKFRKRCIHCENTTLTIRSSQVQGLIHELLYARKASTQPLIRE